MSLIVNDTADAPPDSAAAPDGVPDGVLRSVEVPMAERERRVASGLTPNGSSCHGAVRPTPWTALPVGSPCSGWQHRLAVLQGVPVSR